MSRLPAVGGAAFQGRPGAFSEIAARVLAGADAPLVPCDTFAAAVAALDVGQVRLAVLPIVNVIAGGVAEALDLVVARDDLVVVGAVTVPVEMALLAPPGVPVEAIRRVHSHPVALAQCRRFFAAHPSMTPVPAFDTAGAVEAVVAEATGDEAALAGVHAAAIYGAAVLREGVQDHPANATRFLALARAATAPPEDADRCLVVATLPDAALGELLVALAREGWEASLVERRPEGSSLGRARVVVELARRGGGVPARGPWHAAMAAGVRPEVRGAYRAKPPVNAVETAA